MEPGLKDREYCVCVCARVCVCVAAMEPGLRDREYGRITATAIGAAGAAMEPGLRDREYVVLVNGRPSLYAKLQWSPVLETGNTQKKWPRQHLFC